jgi:hypothetical protein
MTRDMLLNGASQAVLHESDAAGAQNKSGWHFTMMAN